MKLHWAPVLVAAVLISSLAGGQDAAKTEAVVKAGGSTYFTAKMDNLTQQLQLTPDQVVKIKPIAEQEVGYLEQVRANPVVSQKDKIKRLKKIVQDSDTQMKPILSSEQWQKLQNLRTAQKEQLKEYAASAKTGS